ncbi:MAG: hypothetical protein IIA60_06160 [Candidatus Marinimicrobia bacterium]|nr:hypothetical protein [Candidatus Neomarinimicrobiota bacterium]
MKYYRRATILLVGLAVGSTLLITKTENIIPIMILLLSPLIIGIWLGLIVPYMHLGVYALIGGIGGVAAFITVVIALGGGIQWSGIIPVGFFIISFSTGGLIGDWIERKRSPIRPTAAFAEKIARGVVGSTNSPSPQVESKVKRLADIFAALGPLLSLIGTIIAAYFAFRASILPK